MTMTLDRCSVVDEQAEAVREAIDSAVTAMVKAVREGERSLCLGYLEAGALAHEIVLAKLKLHEKRESAVRLVNEQLAAHTSVKVVANRLIRSWASYDLLVVEAGLEDEAAGVPYSHWRDAWSLLVQRTAKDTPEERYVLLEGVEQAARDLFARSLANGTPKEACVEQARELVAKAKNRSVKQKPAKRTDRPAPGENLIQSSGAAKDVAAYFAQTIQQHADPDLVLVELISSLINVETRAPIAAFRSDAVQDAIMAAVWAIEEAAAASAGQDRRGKFRRR